MGIENLNKKNPPTPASSPSATSTKVEVLLHIVEVLLHIVEVLLLIYFYLFTVEVALEELAGVAGRREEQPCKCKRKLLS